MIRLRLIDDKGRPHQKSKTCHLCKVKDLPRKGIIPAKGYHERTLGHRLGQPGNYMIRPLETLIHSVVPDMDGPFSVLGVVRSYFCDSD